MTIPRGIKKMKKCKTCGGEARDGISINRGDSLTLVFCSTLCLIKDQKKFIDYIEQSALCYPENNGTYFDITYYN